MPDSTASSITRISPSRRSFTARNSTLSPLTRPALISARARSAAGIGGSSARMVSTSRPFARASPPPGCQAMARSMIMVQVEMDRIGQPKRARFEALAVARADIAVAHDNAAQFAALGSQL